MSNSSVTVKRLPKTVCLDSQELYQEGPSVRESTTGVPLYFGFLYRRSSSKKIVMSGIAGARLKQERKDWRRDPNRPFVSVYIGEVSPRVLTAAPGICVAGVYLSSRLRFWDLG